MSKQKYINMVKMNAKALIAILMSTYMLLIGMYSTSNNYITTVHIVFILHQTFKQVLENAKKEIDVKNQIHHLL